jgi:hypothetical protein
MSQLGRITGPLLKSNLIRNGVDLAFETNLLYLDVNNSRIGIRKSAPNIEHELDVNGTIRSNELIVETRADIENISIYGNTIESDSDTIIFDAAVGEPTVYHARLQIDDLEIANNTISTFNSNASIDVDPNGTGEINLLANTNITGNLDVTGNVTAVGNVTIGGNIVIGDSLTDTITINASIQSDLIPETDDTFDLGSLSFRWRTVYVNEFYTNAVNLPTLDVGNLMFRDNEITTTTGSDLYIDGNGSGGVRFGNFRIVDNVITNVSSNSITQIAQTGTGYFKIATTNGFVPPRGTNAERPTAYAVQGMTRYNTELKALEVWDGAAWASPAGASGAVSEIVANDIAASFALILG